MKTNTGALLMLLVTGFFAFLCAFNVAVVENAARAAMTAANATAYFVLFVYYVRNPDA